MAGFKIDKSLNALDNSFDPLYGNDTELFLKMLTSNKEQKSKTYFEKLCCTNQIPDFNNLFDKLMQMNLDYGYVLDLIDDIKIITHDNKNYVLLDIKNTLEKIYGINDSKFQEIIFVSLYDKNIANNLLEMQKNMDPIKNINSILRCDLKIIIGNIALSNTERKQRQINIYNYSLNRYRKDGLKLEDKKILAVGSTLEDNTGNKFNKKITIFADSNYADLNGDIHNTIDFLHMQTKTHNKFKIINFNVPATVFNNLDKNLCLLLKLYDLLAVNGFIYIWCGSTCQNPLSNYQFANDLIINAGFDLVNIVNANKKIYGDYEEYQQIFTTNRNLPLSKTTNGLYLLVRKSSN